MTFLLSAFLKGKSTKIQCICYGCDNSILNFLHQLYPWGLEARPRSSLLLFAPSCSSFHPSLSTPPPPSSSRLSLKYYIGVDLKLKRPTTIQFTRMLSEWGRSRAAFIAAFHAPILAKNVSMNNWMPLGVLSRILIAFVTLIIKQKSINKASAYLSFSVAGK